MAAQPEQQPQQQQQQPPAGAPQEPAEGKAVWQGTSAEHAQQMVDKATQRNPMVKFMLDKMAEVRAATACRRSCRHSCVARFTVCMQPAHSTPGC